MPMKSWDALTSTATHQTVKGRELKHSVATGQWKQRDITNTRWIDCAPPVDQVVPKPTTVGTSRGSKQHLMVAVGGPWDGERVVLPKPSGSPHGLPIRVGDWHGRYNLDTGAWSDMKVEAV